MKVMLVDDNRLMLEGLKSLLEVHDIQVVGTAKDGKESVSLAQELRPDVILMDIRMPVYNGLEATRLIKAQMPEAKIIILTTSAEEQDLFEAVKSGACGYLLKSMDADELVEALDQAMQGIPPFSPGLAARLLGEFARLVTSTEADRPPSGAPKGPEATPQKSLTNRQAEVLGLIAGGLTYKEVAARLNLSPRTVKYHMAEIMEQLHLQNRAQVLAYAGRMGLHLSKPNN